MSYIRNHLYTRKEPIEGTDPQEFKEYREVLTLTRLLDLYMSDDVLVVLLDDMHERVEVPNINPKNNKVIGTKKVQDSNQSISIMTIRCDLKTNKVES